MSNMVYNIDDCTVTVVLHLDKQADDKRDRNTPPLEIECLVCTRCQIPCSLMNSVSTCNEHQCYKPSGIKLKQKLRLIPETQITPDNSKNKEHQSQLACRYQVEISKLAVPLGPYRLIRYKKTSRQPKPRSRRAKTKTKFHMPSK